MYFRASAELIPRAPLFTLWLAELETVRPPPQETRSSCDVHIDYGLLVGARTDLVRHYARYLSIFREWSERSRSRSRHVVCFLSVVGAVLPPDGAMSLSTWTAPPL